MRAESWVKVMLKHVEPHGRVEQGFANEIDLCQQQKLNVQSICHVIVFTCNMMHNKGGTGFYQQRPSNTSHSTQLRTSSSKIGKGNHSCHVITVDEN